MARARNIKPSFFQNEELGELLPIERLAFIGMWTIADFKGCIELRPKRLKVQLLPYDECDFESIVINLEKSGFISIYSVQGQRYIKIINFEKHQNPHKNERESGSDIPDILERDDLSNKNNDLENIKNNPDKNGTAPADSLNPIPDSLKPHKTIVRSATARFNEFWLSWPSSPRKVAKAACEKKWSAKKLDLIADQILQHVASMKLTKQWLDGFDPAPLTYINQGRWSDEVFVSDGKSPSNTKPWYISSTGIETKGKELGIETLPDENFAYYKARVYEAAGITNDMIRAANQDYAKRA